MDNHVHAVVGVTRPECSISAMGPVPNGDAPQVGPVPNASCASDPSEVGKNVASVCVTADFAASQMGPVPSGGGAAAGSVPRGWWMRRVAQIGAGKVFGSAAFVMQKASGLGHLFPTKRVVARAVGEIGFATHGRTDGSWRRRTRRGMRGRSREEGERVTRHYRQGGG